MTTATSGTGTVTLGSAVSGYLSFANAGVANAEVVTYVLEEGANREIGRGTYTSSGTTLSRDTVLNSTAGGTTKITLAGAAQVFITAAAEDIEQAASATEAGRVELATDAETITGTDATRAVTPAGLAAASPTRIVKTSDTTRNSNTTTSADPALQFAMAASTIYDIRIVIKLRTTAASDFKWGLTGPASPTEVYGGQVGGFGAAGTFEAYPTNLAYIGSSDGAGVLHVELTVENGANSGTFSFDWAQNSSGGGPTVVKAGSYIEYRTR